MAVYHVLPVNTLCKNPIPPLIDIYVVLQREQQQQETLELPLIIRIPLEVILKASQDENNTQFNINTSDIKPAIWKLFKKKDLLGMLNIYGDNNRSSLDQLRLCWRSVESTKLSGDGAASAVKATAISISTPADGENVEWISENSELVGPQLIEQVNFTHHLHKNKHGIRNLKRLNIVVYNRNIDWSYVQLILRITNVVPRFVYISSIDHYC